LRHFILGQAAVRAQAGTLNRVFNSLICYSAGRPGFDAVAPSTLPIEFELPETAEDRDGSDLTVPS